METKITFLRRGEAANFLKLNYGYGSHQTLAKLATIGGGPPFRKTGPNRGSPALYDLAKLKAWADARLGREFTSTSEYVKQRKARKA
jgi:hypothetical protein